MALLSIVATIAYTVPPFLHCHRYSTYQLSKRIQAAIFLCLVTVGIQIATVATFLLLYYAEHASEVQHVFWPLTKLLMVAMPMQFVVMTIAILIIESGVEDRRIRAALRTSEERYRSIVQYNPIGVSAVDLDDRYILVNSAFEEMTGYTQSELLGESRLKLYYPEDYALANEVMDVSLMGEVKEFEANFRHKSGSKLTTRCTAVPMIVNNKVVGYYALVKDITEQRATAELLRQSEKLSMVGQLAAGVAHEIRNPLTSLKGFLTLIDRESSSNTVHTYVSIMQQELSRIDLISGEMLALAKPQAANFHNCDLDVIIGDVVTLLEAQAHMSGVEMLTYNMAMAHRVWCEENQLKQVFINVIRNAIDAMPGGGTVSVTAERTDRKVVISVQDTGTGMSKEVLDRLGEPFYSTKGNGTGLGLMVTHEIITRHGGQMEYVSIPGKGTTVRIFLNVPDPLDQPAMADASPEYSTVGL